MCGIFLSVGFEPDPKYIDAVEHRGPDGRGWRVFQSPAGPVAMGHRRLSIIDLNARANQPMATPDGRFWLTYNGEIYNYVELRSELEAEGEIFETTSDSEVLLRLVSRHGAQALSRLNGMFAFVLWDDLSKRLLLVRDRVGVKPLVFHHSSQGIAFGSEIKQLVSLPSFRRKINPHRAHDYLSLGITDHARETMYADAFNIRPGRFVELDLNTWRPGQTIEEKIWWSLPEGNGPALSEKEAAETFYNLFEDSVRLQTRSDVLVGSCLSGGLDSSAIVCEQARQLGPAVTPANAITAIFPGSRLDESRYAQDVVDYAGVSGHTISFTEESLLNDVETILRAHDEPYGSASIHAQHYVFLKAKQTGTKVMLDGQGADELMAGYHGCFHFHYAELVRQYQLMGLMKTVWERWKWHGLGPRQQLQPYLHKLPAPLRILLRRNDAAPPPLPWLGGEFAKQYAPAGGHVLTEALQREGMGPVRSVGDYCRILTRSTNLPMLLRYEDRNSMNHSIEARVPFLDHRLVEFCIGLGSQHKIVGGDTKRVLRHAIAGKLPENIRTRRDKIGFATPEEEWMKGPLKNAALAGIVETLDLFPEIFDRENTLEHARSMLDGKRPFDFNLWRIMLFGRWAKQFQMQL